MQSVQQVDESKVSHVWQLGDDLSVRCRCQSSGSPDQSIQSTRTRLGPSTRPVCWRIGSIDQSTMGGCTEMNAGAAARLTLTEATNEKPTTP